MLVKFKKVQIIEGLQKAVNIIPTKTGAAFLRTVWLMAEDGLLKIMSTDSNVEFSGAYAVEVIEPGMVGVSGRSLSDLIYRLPDGDMTLKLDVASNTLSVEQGRRRYKLPVNDSTWFQDFNAFPEDGCVTWSGDFVQEMIDNVSYCVGDDDTMEALSCMSVKKSQEEGKLDVCGLNGHQFAMVRFSNPDLLTLIGDGVLVKKKFLTELKRWLTKDEIEFNISEKRMFFRTGSRNETFSLPLHFYKYPNYYSFLSSVQTATSVMEVNRPELIGSLERINIFNTESHRCTFFNFKGGELTLQSQGQDVGEATENLEIGYQGELERIAFPTKGLIDILGHFHSATVSFRLTGAEGPCGVYGADDPDYMVIVMPMKIQEETYYAEEEA